MDQAFVADLAQKKSGLAVGYYIFVFILLIIAAVLLFTLIKSKIKKTQSFFIKIVILILLTCTLISNLFEGIASSIMARNLYSDSNEMTCAETCGSITESYTQAKTGFVVINSESFLYLSYELKANIEVGKAYQIKYFTHSKLICEISEKRISVPYKF